MTEQMTPFKGDWFWQLEDPSVVPTREPRQPQVGAHWFDAGAQVLYVWDGDEWEPVPAD